MTTWNIAEMNVIRWSEARKIIPNSTSLAQLKKAYEEMDELRQAIESRDKGEIIDGLGDILVCLINVAALENLDLTKCLFHAYNEIKDRTGTMNEDGIFVKDVQG
jgi:NTP pyrophosphatase (non-canonical NTP hydrolase)